MQTAEILKFQPKEVVRVAEIENGYIRIANDLYDALIAADLTKHQQKVAHALVRLTYGYNKKADRIADSQIAEKAKLPRCKINIAKNELLEMKVLISDGKKIGINKNISEWNIEKSYQNSNTLRNGNKVTENVTKSVTKTVTTLLPKTIHTKDIISKDNKNNYMSSDNDVRSSKSKKIKPDYQAVLEAYQEVVLDGLPVPDKLNKKRKTLINHLYAEIKNPSIESVKKYFTGLMAQVKDKQFYFGGPNRDGWRLNFDYALHVDTLTKTREGAL